MAWPKVIEVGGVKVPVESWDEVREVRTVIQELRVRERALEALRTSTQRMIAKHRASLEKLGR